jgi:hypothetical protein
MVISHNLILNFGALGMVCQRGKVEIDFVPIKDPIRRASLRVTMLPRTVQVLPAWPPCSILPVAVLDERQASGS